MRLAGADRAHDVDPRNDRAEVVRRPADEREDRIGREADDATATVEYLLVCGMAEPYPVFDLLLMPRQFNVGEERLQRGRRCAPGARPPGPRRGSDGTTGGRGN